MGSVAFHTLHLALSSSSFHCHGVWSCVLKAGRLTLATASTCCQHCPQEEGVKAGASRVFSAWDKLATTALVDQASGDSGTFTLFTVDDATWTGLLPANRADPLSLDPVTQRLVLASQLVAGQVNLSQPSNVRAGGGQLCLLEKILFIRLEDVDVGVERAEGR